MKVYHLCLRVLQLEGVTHRMHQVGLTQAHAAVQKKWVIGIAGILGDLFGRRQGQLIGFTLDKIVEGVVFYQVVLVLQ